MKLKKLISLVLCFVLIFSCVLPLASCKKKKNDNNTDNNPGGTIIGGNADGNTDYTVKVQTVGGMPLEGVMVFIHNGDGYSVCTAPQETDKNGIAKFTLKTSNTYSVQVDGVPEGYNVREGLTKDDRYPLTAPDTVISLSSAPIEEGGFADNYELGDVMYDFTLTDINGVDYRLSELLKTKDMVMLNFWYRDCSNCGYEFPYINTVYDAYKDDIEILAINDFPSDTEEMVKGYSEYLNVDLKMPLFKVGNGEDDLALSRFGSNGYPTSVVIDRYGVVVMIEIGAVLGESKWKNIFDNFTGDDYKQQLITDPSILNPMIEPTIKWTDESAQQIADAFNFGDITVSYHPETSEKDAKYSWPFIVDEYNGETVVRPSNNGIDNSYSILYAEVSLKPGEAIMFDYFCSTQRNDYGTDVLYVLVDGKDIYSMAGINEDGYETCCTYVDPRPLTESNKNDVATYTVAFAFYKDTVDYSGDDTVYLKNLRVVPATEIPVETYIFRYAATDLNSAKDGYNTYVEVFYNEADGYYHVGSVDGPLLLANHLSYTQFDSKMTISERVHANYELMVGEVNMFNNWLIYGNAASNSNVPYYSPVTEELKDMLVAYCNKYKGEVGKADDENLWLQLCAYYDAYGKVNGVPTPQLEDPIIGLTSFSAHVMNVKDGAYERDEVVSSAEVEYTKVIMPRGYLYKFVPKVSGVYRVTSKSVGKEVNGWIFIDGDKWADEGDRVMLTSYETAERYCPDLIINNNGTFVHDNINTSLVAYMEAGKEYFIDIAYYDVYETGKFTFDVKWISESFGHFIQASPGPITYIESITGGMGQLIAGGIDVDFKNEGGVEYAYHVIERNPDGTVKTWGSKIYADFYYPTTLFPTQSIETLIKANAFNYTITEKDREALIILDSIRLDGKAALIAKWIADEVVADNAAGEEKWTADGLDDIVKDYYDGDFDSTYTSEEQNLAQYVWNEGIYALKAEWALTMNGMSSAKWASLDMDKVLRGTFSEDATLKAQQESTLAEVNSLFAYNWQDYQMEDVRIGVFHNTDERTDKDIKAEEYLKVWANGEGKEELKAIWDDLFNAVLPGESENVTDISEWRFNYFWNYYQMDDVKNGIFHGTNKDFTPQINAYVAMMDNNPDHPERQGCVAVTRELAEILDTLVSRELFENVHNGWLKFCFYYNYLGV